MSFKSKKLPKNNLGFLKGATLFFLGTSVVLFMANAFEIVPSVPNAIQYIANIVLTQEGTNTSATGVILQGSGGHAWFKGDVSIASLPNKVCLGTNSNGKIVEWTCWAWGSDTKVGTWVEGRRCVYTGDKIVCDQTMPVGSTGAVWPAWPQWATGAVWPAGPQWPIWATWTFEGIETDPIFSGGKEGKRCILENGKIECTQDTPAGGTWAQPAGAVTNIQFKNTDSTLSGTDSLVWKDDNLGIGTSGPTEKLTVNGNMTFAAWIWVATRILWYAWSSPLGDSPDILLIRGQANDDSIWGSYVKIVGWGEFNDADAIGNVILTETWVYGGNVGIGTTTPTEKFQIEDYIWMGKNTSVKTWGSFLRMYGYANSFVRGGEAENKEYAPNIQLNFTQQNQPTPGMPDTYSSYQRQIKNNKSFLQFNFFTGGDYVNNFAIWSDGSVGIGGSLGIGTSTPTCGSSTTCGLHMSQKDMYIEDGEVSVINSKIIMAPDTNMGYSYDSYPVNSLYIGNKIVAWGSAITQQPYISDYEKNDTHLSLIVQGAMKLRTLHTGKSCYSGNVWTIITSGDDTSHILACLGSNGTYTWKQLDN